MKIWNKLIALIAKIPVDKLYHFIAGLMIMAVLGVMFGLGAWAIIAVVIAAVAKEIIDYKAYGHFDIKDAVATIIGGAVLMICIICKYVLPWSL